MHPGAQASLEPAGPEAMAVALAKLLDWIADFGIAPIPSGEHARAAYLERLAGRYREHLRNLPADLVLRCVDETMAAHRFRNLPVPAEMIARGSGEIARRRVALDACRLALKIGRFEHPPVPLADRARPEQVRHCRQEIAGSLLRTMPGSDTPEYGEPPPPPNPRQDRGADR